MKSTHIEMTYRNCHGGGTIPAFFQADLASDNYDIIYCVYDVDFKPNDENGMYGRIRKGLYRVLGEESEIDNIINSYREINSIFIRKIGNWEDNNK